MLQLPLATAVEMTPILEGRPLVEAILENNHCLFCLCALECSASPQSRSQSVQIGGDFQLCGLKRSY